MGALDWEELLVVRVTELIPEEREALCESLVACEINPDATLENLRHILSLAQSLLGFRGEQIQNLRLEMKDMTAKQIEIQEDFKQEISEFQQHASTGKKLKRGAYRHSGDTSHELTRLQKQNKELQAELEFLKRKRNHTEFGNVEEEEGNSEEEHHKLLRTLELQTGHISRLLSDVEANEAENRVLKEKLASLRDKLAQATENLAGITTELTSAQNICLEYKGKCTDLESENRALRQQVAELVEHRCQLDKQLHDFQQDVDTRVESWKVLMESKDAELEDMRAHLALHQPEQMTQLQNTVSALIQALASREQQIEELAQHLAEATQELTSSASALEHLQLDKADGDESRRLWQQLQQALNRERKLENRLRQAENDDKSRAEEVTMLSNELQRMEHGELGLAEALTELRAVKKSLLLRDKDIESFVKTINELQAQLDEISDQNFILRKRLRIESGSEIDIAEISEHRTLERQKSEALLKQIASLEAERIALKLELRDSQRHIRGENRVSNLSPDQEVIPLQELQEELKNVIEENESLRKGMHEIFDSIQKQDATSEIHLESACLERLLEALDTRHVAGWYHPAMRLQAQLFATQGAAAELREQLRVARDKEKQFHQRLIDVQTTDNVSTSLAVTSGVQTSLQTLDPNATFIHKSVEKDKNGEWSKSMRSQVTDIVQLFSDLSSCLPVFTEAVHADYAEVMNQLADAKAEAEELRHHLQTNCEHSVAMCAAQTATQRLNERASLRKCHSLEATCNRLRSENLMLSNRIIKIQSQTAEQISDIRNKEAEYKNEVMQLTNLLNGTICETEFQSVHTELLKTSKNLRDLLLEQDKWGPNNENIQKIQEELQQSRECIKNLEDELTRNKSELQALQTQTSHSNLDQQIINISQKLASAEVNESSAIKKIEHANKMCTVLQEQVSELQKHNQDLQKSLLAQLSVNPIFQENTQTKPLQISQVDETKDAGLQEALSIAQQQNLSLQSLVDSNRIELESLRDQVQKLHASSDFHATIGRMSEEILTLRLNESNSQMEVRDLQLQCVEWKSRCQELEKQLHIEQQLRFQFRTETTLKERHIQRQFLHICLKHTACVPLSCLDQCTRWLRKARDNARIAYEAENAATSDWQQFNHLKSQTISNFTGTEDATDLRAQTLELKISNLECKHQANRLSEQLKHTTERLKAVESHAQNLEDQILQLEKDCEQRVITWQLEKYAVLASKSNLTIMDEINKSEITNVVNVYEKFQNSDTTQEEESTLCKEEQSTEPTQMLQVTVEQTASQEPIKTCLQCENFTKEIFLKDSHIESLQKQIQTLSSAGSDIQENKTNVALKAMVSSLSDLISLKEEAISRSRQRLRDVYAEHAQTTRALRLEASQLKESLTRAQAARLQTINAPHTQGPIVVQLLTRVHELEDDLRVANRNSGVLSGQLRAATEEAQRWQEMAQTRQARLQQLQDRYEAQVEEAVSARHRKSTSWLEKAEVEEPEKEDAILFDPELIKSRQELQNLKEMLSRTQTELKNIKSNIDSKTDEDVHEYSSLTDKEKKPNATLPRVSRNEKTLKEMRAMQEKLRLKIKQLEMELEESRAREKTFMDSSKTKTNEGILRWEERKRLQGSCERLKIKLHESEANGVQLKQSNEALRSLIERLERDKMQLETQLRKKHKPITMPISPSIVKLESDISHLRERLTGSEDNCTILRRQLEHQRRIAEDVPRLREEQAALRRELEAERESTLNLQGRNTRLEAANLELSLKLESLQNETHDTQCSELDEMSRAELQRSVLVLGQHVRKLQSRLRSRGETTASLDGSVDTSRSNDGSSTRMSSILKQKSSLEQEIRELRSENINLSSRLEQKVRLLLEVRASLQEASLREASLRAEVASLRNILSRRK